MIREAILIMNKQASIKGLWQNYPVVNNFDNSKKVACIDYSVIVKDDLLSQGFLWLDHWQIIVPFRPYNELLLDYIEDFEDKNVAKLGDLRVPAFDTRLVFLNISDETKEFWSIYRKLTNKYHESVAFYFAIWATKLRYKPLPAGEWLNG